VVKEGYLDITIKEPSTVTAEIVIAHVNSLCKLEDNKIGKFKKQTNMLGRGSNENC
jgi:hypothetical protein